MGRLILKRQILEAMHAFEEAGYPVKGAKLSPDGTMVLLTEAPAGALALNENDDWVSFAGETALPRA